MSGRSREARVRLAALLTLLMAVAVTAGAAQAPTDLPVPFATIAAGKFSRIPTPMTLVLRTQAEWADLWRRAAGPEGAAPPEVDFRREMVAAVFGGQVSEPAAMAITRIARTSDRLMIWYTLTFIRPPLDGGVPVSFAPFHIVRLARSPLPVEFVQVETPPVLRRLP